MDGEVVEGQSAEVAVPAAVVPAVDFEGRDALASDLVTQAFGGVGVGVRDAD
ncbi:MAG: hypothetical protein ACPGWR_15095 [Ardenticatenaceae bacterium]